MTKQQTIRFTILALFIAGILITLFLVLSGFEKKSMKKSREQSEDAWNNKKIDRIQNPSKNDYLVIRGWYTHESELTGKKTSGEISTLFRVLDFEKDSILLQVVDNLGIPTYWRGKADADFFFSPSHLFKKRKASKKDLAKATINRIPLIEIFNPKKYRLHPSEVTAIVKIDRIEY